MNTETFEPTMQLRWLAGRYGEQTLQQAWLGSEGTIEWKDVEIHIES